MVSPQIKLLTQSLTLRYCGAITKFFLPLGTVPLTWLWTFTFLTCDCKPGWISLSGPIILIFLWPWCTLLKYIMTVYCRRPLPTSDWLLTNLLSCYYRDIMNDKQLLVSLYTSCFSMKYLVEYSSVLPSLTLCGVYLWHSSLYDNIKWRLKDNSVFPDNWLSCYLIHWLRLPWALLMPQEEFPKCTARCSYILLSG